MAAASYEESVFVNCPFDTDYQEIFRALVFTVHDCGFLARCALEVDDGGEVRIAKINRIVRGCRHGIHDISRTELDPTERLPRFNMPLELGLFLGAREFGTGRQKQKRVLILDTERYRYQKFCSDIAGQDIKAHEGSGEKRFGRYGTGSRPLSTVLFCSRRPGRWSSGTQPSWQSSRGCARLFTWT